MFQVSTYKQKNRFLLAGTVLFGVLAYWLSISSTVELYRENNLLEMQLDSVQAAPFTISRLNQELEQYEEALGRFGNAQGNREERLLQQIGQITQQHRVMLIQFPPPSIEEQNGYSIQTRVVKMQGSYMNLVKALHDVEQAAFIGRVSSVHFAVEENRKTRKSNLVTYVYMQQLDKEKKNEK